MSHAASPLAAFHLIGDRSALESVNEEPAQFRPALFGIYHDLSRLRTDYPLVLATTPGGGSWVKSLSDIIDDLLQAIAEPGTGGEETRRQVLAQEQVIRSLVAGGQEGTLSELWATAREQLVRGDGEPSAIDGKLDDALTSALDAIPLDGQIIDFDGQLAARLVTRAWQESESLRSQGLQKRVKRLAQKLSDILKVNHMYSPGARQAGPLERSMGSANSAVFDFEAMARILKTAPAAEPLPASRRKRIQSAINVLDSQRFYYCAPGMPGKGKSPFNFEFTDCGEALDAFRERLPEMAALVKAIAIAELEIDNHYNESRHDRFFKEFGEHQLGPRDLELFPGYLISVSQVDDQAQQQILQILRAGLPFKIIAQTNDILGDDSLAGGQLTFGTQGQQLARMALGIDRAFVLQAAASSLYRVRDAVLDGVSTSGPALFSIYCGADYLETAAATESRAFPCFVYNPAAGPTQADCFSLAGNPALEHDWTGHDLNYENPDHDYESEQTTFTLVDFIAQAPRFAGRFVSIPGDDWSDELVPVSGFFALSGRAKVDKVPYVPLIDNDNVLYRAVVDEKLLDAARRCLSAWHKLQEMGGINNSHAAAAVAEAKIAWEAEYVPPAAQPEPTPAPSTGAPAPEAAAAAPEPAEAIAPEPAPSSDDPWIETIRCTTCNECTQLNDRMFSYDSEKRAFIKDPDAGTYRELVEAAETCQVAIIHPGKPRNPDEPGLEELLERAAPFM